MPVEILVTFFFISLLLAAAPGPDNIFVLTQSALFGHAAGMLVTLGLCTGLVVHSLVVALGLAALLQASAIAFTALRFAGAMYLLFLAWQAFSAAARHLGQGRHRSLTTIQLYRRGVIMNLTNPKVSLFFLAFLPQFTDPSYGPLILQIFLLGGLFILATLLVFFNVALLAGILGQWLNTSPVAQKLMNGIAGAIFTGLALKLIVIR